MARNISMVTFHNMKDTDFMKESKAKENIDLLRIFCFDSKLSFKV